MKDKERTRLRRAEMVRAGLTYAAVAREAGVSEVMVYYVLTEQRKGYRVRRAIAQMVGKPVETLWPDTPVKYRKAA